MKKVPPLTGFERLDLVAKARAPLGQPVGVALVDIVHEMGT